MPKLTYHCPLCQKELILVEEIQLGTEKLNRYKCGHLFAKGLHKIETESLDFNAVDGSGKTCRDYQKTGVQFIVESDYNCIIGDQMRLGKTPQALTALKNGYKERTPCLILVRSANLWQWIREYKVWVDTLPNGIFPILGTAAWIPPGFSSYIISMDTFSRPKMIEQLKRIPFKLIIADEAHSFKNTDSIRSQALTDFVTFLNTGEEFLVVDFTCTRCATEWVETGKRKYDKRFGNTVISKEANCPKCGNYCYVQQHESKKKRAPEATEKLNALIALSQDQSTTEHERALALTHVKRIKAESKIPLDKPCGLILLTGTAIKNRAEEYFVPLNLVNPEKFSSLEQFRRTWLEQDTRGRWVRVKNYMMDSFKETIKPYVLRREKEDVYKDLPPLNRTFTVIEPDKGIYAKIYNDMLDKMDAKLVEKANPTYWDFADDLMELRRICGLMKLSWLADYLEVSLLDSENQRFAVGIHHKAVRDVLYNKLGGHENCLKLSGEDSAWQKDQIMRGFESSKQRVLIINMLAGGVGMDFHYCNNVLILERQWSSADEEQFEFRFYNPDLSIKSESTNIEYIIAKGTQDEWWHDMVETKRQIFGETIATHWNIQTDSVSFKELIERTVGSKL